LFELPKKNRSLLNGKQD